MFKKTTAVLKLKQTKMREEQVDDEVKYNKLRIKYRSLPV